MIRRRAALAVLAGVLVVAGCSPQDGDAAAGVRVSAATTASPGTTSAGTPSAGSDEGAADPAVVAAAGLEPCPTSNPTATSVADGLPDLTLPCVGDGPDVRLSSLRGTPMVVNVWAGWCGPCQEELPVLATVAREAKRAGGPVTFLGIDALETSPDDAVALLGSTGATYPSVRDDDGATRAGLRWAGPPMTVLVRADGTIAYRLPAPLTSTGQLRELLRDHLGVDLT